MNNSPSPRFVVPLAKPTLAHVSPALSDETPEVAVRQFVARVGGVANARAALDLLTLLQNIRHDAARKAA